MQEAFLCKEGANSAQKRETAVQFTTQTINMLLPREMHGGQMSRREL